MSTHLFPAINTALLMLLLIFLVWRYRVVDVGKIWDEIEAIKLRLMVQEKVAPCEHCRAHHGLGSGADCDC